MDAWLYNSFTVDIFAGGVDANCVCDRIVIFEMSVKISRKVSRSEPFARIEMQ